jgi:uncharacterized C2H2 Zn-finger protein
MRDKNARMKRSVPGNRSNNTDYPKKDSSSSTFSDGDKLHKCSKCHAYFVDYSTAKLHFDKYHSMHLGQMQAKKTNPHKSQR